MSKEKYRSRNHMLLLYPDCQEHKDAMEKIKASYDYLAILHNKDTWDEKDFKKNPEHKVGELKKDHWHVILKFDDARWSTALCKELGIEHNFIEQPEKLDNAMQYLLHYNNSDKAQYDIDEVFGTFKDKLEESIDKKQLTEGEKVADLIDAIVSKDSKWTVTEFAKHCAVNGYWAEFRRSGAIFCKIIDEHNQRIEYDKYAPAPADE